MNFRNSIFLVLIATFSACNKNIDLPDFDESQWQNDQNGCKDTRAQMLDQMEQVKDQLKGLNQDEIVYVLGKPDKNELYKRNQKFFIYEIAGAKGCTPSKEAASSHIYLSIRFNATGLAKEVMVYRE